MKYTSNPTVLVYIDKMVKGILDPSFDALSLPIQTRMFKSMRLIGEIDRLTRFLQVVPTTIQVKLMSEIDRINNAVKVLSEDVPTSEQFSAIDKSINHPYVKLLLENINRGFTVDQSIKAIAQTTGEPELLIKRFMDDNGIDLNALSNTQVIKESYQSGISSANIDKTIENMYEQAKAKCSTESEYESFIKGFSSIANFSSDVIDFEIMKNKVVNYSKTLDITILPKLQKYFYNQYYEEVIL